jgi:hypothetical protein
VGVLGAERLAPRRADVVAEGAIEPPALPLEPGDQVGRERLEDRGGVGDRRRTARLGRDEAGSIIVPGNCRP